MLIGLILKAYERVIKFQGHDKNHPLLEQSRKTKSRSLRKHLKPHVARNVFGEVGLAYHNHLRSASAKQLRVIFHFNKIETKTKLLRT